MRYRHVGHLPHAVLKAIAPQIDNSLCKLTILYVEDNPANVTLVRAILSMRGDIEFLSAPTAREGIDLAHEHGPDLILLDLRLPDMYGTQAFRHLQADLETASIPVIALSADVTRHRIDEILELGFAGFIAKPFDPDELIEKIDAATDAARPDPSAAVHCRTAPARCRH